MAMTCTYRKGTDMMRIALIAASGFLLVGCQSTPMTSEPASGTLAYGSKVLVDDGTCPEGQIKQITGGNGGKIGRKRECIAKTM